MKHSDEVIAATIKWINDNVEQNLLIDDIARHSGYSKWHLQRLFSRYTGVPLGKYIRLKRLDNARKELLQSSSTLYDICLRNGFDSQQSFTRVFSKEFNIPPGAYRRKNR